MTTSENETQKEARSGEVRPSRSFSFRQRVSLTLITWAGFLLIRWLGATLRFQIIREPDCIGHGWGTPNGIWCFWHQCVIPAAYRFRGKQYVIMVSRSFDGEYIARIVERLGFRTVRGSSSRGAVGALLGMRQEIDQGHPVVFTIDGPRGPRYVAKPGPVLLGKMTGQPVCCFHMAVERAWTLNSWDRMLIPKPFSRVVIYGSNPLYVPAGATEEEMSALHRKLQENLDRCRLKAEEAVSS